MKVFWQQCEGQVVDGFPLLQYLGGGDDQAVFLTEHAGDSSQKAAIKLRHADPESTEDQLRRWRLAAELSHPNLVRLFERGTWQLNKVPLLYVVMEYAEENLSQVIPERPLTVEEARQMLEPAVDVLGYLHSNGYVHGRLKPSNFLAIDNCLKISSDVIAPVGPGTATPADDVWSLGITLVEALTQRLPVWNAADARDPVLPQALPAEFQEIARQALRRDPRARWTVVDIRKRLRGETTSAPKRMNAAVAASAVLLVLFAGVAGTLLVRNHESPHVSKSQEQPTQAEPSPAQPQPKPDPVAATPVPPPSPPAPESKPAPARSIEGEAEGEVVHEVLPDVLPRARSSIHGKVAVNVRVDVDPSGNVSGATLESAGVSKYFGGLADQAARRWKFAPADVPRVWILKFEFTRGGTKVTPVKATP